MYKITIKKDALKELKQLPKNSAIVISSTIDQLSENPRPAGCKKLKGDKIDFWRIRVGNYRVLYIIDDIIRIVDVHRVGHRKDIYH